MRQTAAKIIVLVNAAGLDPGLNGYGRSVMFFVDINMQAIIESKASDVGEIILLQQKEIPGLWTFLINFHYSFYS